MFVYSNVAISFMAKIPGPVIFGIDSLGSSINYAFVREVQDESELINLLRLRLKVFFIDQVQSLQNSKAAFPLTTMTCIGIETLGRIFVNDNKDDASYQFVETIKKIHQSFGRKPNKRYFDKLKEIWSEKNLSNIDSFGKIVYRFFRNTMIHGYQGKGVFLSYEDTSSVEIDNEFAFIKINPDWFWNNFKSYYERKFDSVVSAQSNSTERQNCLNYIRSYLLE